MLRVKLVSINKTMTIKGVVRWIKNRFIGCGNMGKAILGGLIASGQVLPGQIWVYTPSPEKVAELHDRFGINAAQSRKRWRRLLISFLLPSNPALW